MTTTSSASSVPPVQVESLTVKTGRLEARVRIRDPRYRYTSPRLAAELTKAFPSLPHHACVNASGSTFGCVMDATSVAHALEHLAIECMVRDSRDPQARFAGTSEWVDENAGLARVQVSFADDLQALRAFNKAARFLNIAVLR